MNHSLLQECPFDVCDLSILFSFVDPFCYLCFVFVFVILSCLFLVAL